MAFNVLSNLPLSLVIISNTYIGLQAYAKVCLSPTPMLDLGLELVGKVELLAQVSASLVFVKGGVRVKATLVDAGVGPAVSFTFQTGIDHCFHIPARIGGLKGFMKTFWSTLTCMERDGEACLWGICVPSYRLSYCDEHVDTIVSFDGFDVHKDLWSNCKLSDWKVPVAAKSVRLRQVRPHCILSVACCYWRGEEWEGAWLR
jgi:hypothetical protein